MSRAWRPPIDHGSQPAVVVSFVTVTELGYGALKAGWGDLRRRGLERDLAQLVIVQPDDELMQMSQGGDLDGALAAAPLHRGPAARIRKRARQSR